MINLTELGQRAKQATFKLTQCTTAQKNQALENIAHLLEQQTEQILQENQKDIHIAKQNALSDALIDRLLLTTERIQNMANDVRHVMTLADPVGQIIDQRTLENGLVLTRQRVPIGVIGTIYEARPNVTVDVASLCLKTGNAVILRGGKETVYTNKILVDLIQQALMKAQLPPDAILAITDMDRKWIMQLLTLDRYVDMIIPRGGQELQNLCKHHATMPVILGGIGVCHLFVEQSVKVEKALAVIKNAKIQRPTTCNSLETLLVQRQIATTFLPALACYLGDQVQLHADDEALKILNMNGFLATKITNEVLGQEWLSSDLNIVIVEDTQQAIEHIRIYGSQHSEGILTENTQLATQFVNQVDAATVYINASTRFTDGAQFGLGAEVAVSTQKLHARGPMALEALTTYKWIAKGDYACRM